MKSRRALGKPIQSEVGVSKTKNRPRGSVFVLSCVDKKDAYIYLSVLQNPGRMLISFRPIFPIVNCVPFCMRKYNAFPT